MNILSFKVLPIVIGLLQSQMQAGKSTHPWWWYLKVKKTETEALAKEEAIKAKERNAPENSLKKMSKIQYS